tara:strand:+ start:298 stop:525 length:228 start_codon:yes stop_codon:yes gene_type:complete
MKLFICDDDVNSFDHVIRVIQRYLAYPYSQACSIANIVHNSGECLVKTDSDDSIIELYDTLKENGLTLRVADENE